MKYVDWPSFQQLQNGRIKRWHDIDVVWGLSEGFLQIQTNITNGIKYLLRAKLIDVL